MIFIKPATFGLPFCDANYCHTRPSRCELNIITNCKFSFRHFKRPDQKISGVFRCKILKCVGDSIWFKNTLALYSKRIFLLKNLVPVGLLHTAKFHFTRDPVASPDYTSIYACMKFVFLI